MSASRPRARELLVLAAGLAAAAALAWAGATVHRGLAAATEATAIRLSRAVVDTVGVEWQRMLRSDDPPVVAAGETFTFRDESPLEPFVLHEVSAPAEPTAFEALLSEAERRELVEGDRAGALEFVLEALKKDPEAPRRAEGWLRALQLGVALNRDEVVQECWISLRGLELTEARDGIPYRLLAALALGAVPDRSLAPEADLQGLFLEQDRLLLGTAEEPASRFEPAPMLVALCAHVGLALPSLERRKWRALAAEVDLPSVASDGRWHPVEVAGRPFLVRDRAGLRTGWFYDPGELQQNLSDRSSMPPGFALDFEGTDKALGTAVAPRTPLEETPFAFTLRHGDPAQLGREEASRLRLLRGALFALSLACAAGGFLTARLLARQRKLAELKSSFIAGVSHDLRTPLASILLLAENLESGVAAGADPARYHRALRKEATRLRRLVDDVLDFSRLERGQAPKLEREELDLARFAAELEEDLGARVREQGREFVCERAGLPASAALDAHAVRRALENLVDNALKHGTGAVTLAFASGAGRLRLSVADDGPGVPVAERERVFEPFARLASTHVGGVGLGLAIVRSIARAHGGEARVRERGTGAGAVFELDLPLSGDSEEAA